MKTSIQSLAASGLAMALAFALVSCGEEETKESTATSSEDTFLTSVFLDSAPDGAVSVVEARKNITPGETITVSGRVAGAKKPFADQYATLVLADDSLETCERIPGDACETPWDACCVEQDTIAASRITVQVVGEDGRPVGTSLKGVNGLKELDSLVVTGTVAEGSSEENLILNATGIYPGKS